MTALSMIIAAGISYPILGFLLAPTLASAVGSFLGCIAVAVIVYNYTTLKKFLAKSFGEPKAAPAPLAIPDTAVKPILSETHKPQGAELASVIALPQHQKPQGKPLALPSMGATVTSTLSA